MWTMLWLTDIDGVLGNGGEGVDEHNDCQDKEHTVSADQNQEA